MSLDMTFSSNRVALVVPGIAIIPCAATHANAICVRVQPFRVANRLISSTILRLRWKLSPWNFGAVIQLALCMPGPRIEDSMATRTSSTKVIRGKVIR